MTFKKSTSPEDVEDELIASRRSIHCKLPFQYVLINPTEFPTTLCYTIKTATLFLALRRLSDRSLRYYSCTTKRSTRSPRSKARSSAITIDPWTQSSTLSNNEKGYSRICHTLRSLRRGYTGQLLSLEPSWEAKDTRQELFVSFKTLTATLTPYLALEIGRTSGSCLKRCKIPRTFKSPKQHCQSLVSSDRCATRSKTVVALRRG